MGSLLHARLTQTGQSVWVPSVRWSMRVSSRCEDQIVVKGCRFSCILCAVMLQIKILFIISRKEIYSPAKLTVFLSAMIITEVWICFRGPKQVSSISFQFLSPVNHYFCLFLSSIMEGYVICFSINECYIFLLLFLLRDSQYRNVPVYMYRQLKSTVPVFNYSNTTPASPVVSFE